MTIYEKNEKWYFKFQYEGREFNRAAKGAASKRDAEKAEARFKSDLFQGKYGLVENRGKKLFDELYKAYENYAKSNNRSWSKNRSGAAHLLEFFKGKMLKEITPLMIERYRSERKKKLKGVKSVDEEGNKKIIYVPITGSTINREIQMLKKMFNIAINNGWIDINPCSADKIRPFREENKKERYLTPEEEALLLNACTGKLKYLRPFVIIALQTGMRAGEILNLTWNCVDFKNGYIVLLDTKNGKKRYIGLNLVLRKELEEISKDKADENYVLPNPKTGKPYCDLGGFANLCKRVDIKGLRFHDLRHTAATRMVSAGIGLATVQSILGHADLKTTSRYAHPVSEEKQRAMEALAAYNHQASLIKINKEEERLIVPIKTNVNDHPL
jgi:integrase